MLYDDDDIEVLEFTQKDKDQALESQLQEMRGRYSSSVMTRILEKSYAKKPDLARDVYFTKHALIFSPSTDKAECDLPLIEELIRSIEGQDVSSEIFLFPIAEQQPVIKIPLFAHWGWIPPRNHWVTLHYNTKTEIATVIDSRPLINSFMYSYEDLKNTLSKGLESLQLSIKEFNVIQQGLQLDDIYCGAWTAINIESLAYGASIPSLTTTFQRDDIDSIVQHHIDKVFHHKKCSFRNDLINFDIINEYKITPPDIEPIIKPLLSNTDATSFVKLINHRENIVFKGKPLSISNPLLPGNLKHVLKDLRGKYHGILATQIACHSASKKGYSIKDPGRLLNNLKNIGLDEKQINAFSLIEILFYDAVIFYATSEIETQIQMQILEILSRLDEVNEPTMIVGAEYLNQQNDDVRKKSLLILKEKILEHYRHQMNVRMMQRLPIKSVMPLKTTYLISQRIEKPIKLHHLSVARSKKSLMPINSLLTRGTFTDIIFINQVNGHPQFIKLNLGHLFQNPVHVSQSLLHRMKASGWDLSETKMIPYVANKLEVVAIERDDAAYPLIQMPSSQKLNNSDVQWMINITTCVLCFVLIVHKFENRTVNKNSHPEQENFNSREEPALKEPQSSSGSYRGFHFVRAFLVAIWAFFIRIFEWMSVFKPDAMNTGPHPRF